ncbi:MAG: glucosaminidase domain-containing protein [Xylanivirga thermophila]|jgi:uncharacterized protein YjdB|uniref:glucosaminidase domain-containing protein n=1 Tax=Xylanivirga thermophila TaxID=2496273 RepID=UPI0039F5499D
MFGRSVISKVLIFVMILGVIFSTGIFAEVYNAADEVTISGYGHVETYSNVNSEYIKRLVFRLGTMGKGKRIEGLSLKLTNPPANMILVYRGHVQGHGDMPKAGSQNVWKDPKDGSLWLKSNGYIGTKGESKRIEGIQLRLIDTRTNSDYKGYKIEYQVHMAQYGWGIDNRSNALKLTGNPKANVDKWQSNGGFAGTAGESRRIEAINVRIISNNTSGEEVYDGIKFSGSGHVESYGNLNGEYIVEGVTTRLGTMGKGKRIEGLSLKLTNPPANMILVYRGHVQGHGDMPKAGSQNVWKDPKDGSLWLKSNGYIGTKGESKRIEGIQLRLIDTRTNSDYKGYKIEYQVHMAQYGWGIDNRSNALKLTGNPKRNVDKWKSNGAFAGTAGESRRIEAINIRIVKDGQAPKPVDPKPIDPKPTDPAEEDKKAVQLVINLIDTLPEVEEVQEIDDSLKKQVQVVRIAYDRLTLDQQKRVNNVYKLTALEDRIKSGSNGYYCVRYSINRDKVNAVNNIQMLMDRGFKNAFALYIPENDWYWMIVDKFETKQDADRCLQNFRNAGLDGVIDNREFKVSDEIRPEPTAPDSPSNKFVDIVNLLPEPSTIAQIRADDKKRVEEARGIYDNMSGDERTSIPSNLIDKFLAVENKIQSLKTPIIGTTKATILQAQTWAIKKGAHFRYIDIAPTYWYYYGQTGINPEILYSQAAKETNFGRYTGSVRPYMNNWAGIKTANSTGDKTEDHESFETPEDGVRAHFNHMGIYCGVDPIGTPHPRWYITKTAGWAGTIKYIEDLGGKWAPNIDYGISIMRDYTNSIYNTQPLSEEDFEKVQLVIKGICELADKGDLSIEDKANVQSVRMALENLDPNLKTMLDYYNRVLQEIERKVNQI